MASEAAGHLLPSRGFLASLHPGGDPSTVLLIDQAPGPETTDEGGGVVVLSMIDAQCRDAGITEEMIRRALSALAPDGMMWIGVPGRWRLALMDSLRAKGMVIGATFVHRGRGLARTEFALTAKALRFALSGGLVSRRWRWALALLERVPWGEAMLLRFLPGIGFTAFRPGAAPFGWLNNQVPGKESVDIAIKTSWRGERAPFLVFALAEGETVIAKRGSAECQASIAHEAKVLAQLGGDAARAGLAIPQRIDFQKNPRLCSLIETAVPGRPMAGWIRDGHHRDLGIIADRLATWLTEWNSRTVRLVELTPALGELLILSPARELVGRINGGAAYLDWLSHENGLLLGHKVPLVAAHNDLTMANVLGDSSGIQSVVDWEAADPAGLPLADFHYAVCDAATAIGGGDRLAAFRICFLGDGEPRRRLRKCETRLRAIAGGPPQWLELCIHAGWLRHAANEQARPSPRPNESFLAIANLLADGVAGR